MTHIIGIILAAGMSKRMGDNKLLLPVQGIPMLQHVINAAKNSWLTKVLLIVANNVEAHDMLNYLDTENCIILPNPKRHLGQSESLKVGIQYTLCETKPKISGAMVLLGDQPFITTQIINSLIKKAELHPENWIIPLKKSKKLKKINSKGLRGNPVIIPSDEFIRVLDLEGDTGARVLVNDSLCHKHFVEMDETAPFEDIDTPKAYARLCTF